MNDLVKLKKKAGTGTQEKKGKVSKAKQSAPDSSGNSQVEELTRYLKDENQDLQAYTEHLRDLNQDLHLEILQLQGQIKGLQKENRSLLRLLDNERQLKACAAEERDAALQDRENASRSTDGAYLLLQEEKRSLVHLLEDERQFKSHALLLLEEERLRAARLEGERDAAAQEREAAMRSCDDARLLLQSYEEREQSLLLRVEEKEASEGRRDVEEARLRLDTLKAQQRAASLEEQLTSKDRLIRDLEERLRENRTSVSTRVRDLEDALSRARAAVDKTSNEIEDWCMTADGLRRALAQKQVEVEELQSELQQAAGREAAVRAQLHQTAAAAAAESRRQEARYEEEMRRAQNQFDYELQAVRGAHAAEREELHAVLADARARGSTAANLASRLVPLLARY